THLPLDSVVQTSQSLVMLWSREQEIRIGRDIERVPRETKMFSVHVISLDSTQADCPSRYRGQSRPRPPIRICSEVAARHLPKAASGLECRPAAEWRIPSNRARCGRDRQSFPGRPKLATQTYIPQPKQRNCTAAGLASTASPASLADPVRATARPADASPDWLRAPTGFSWPITTHNSRATGRSYESGRPTAARGLAFHSGAAGNRRSVLPANR